MVGLTRREHEILAAATAVLVPVMPPLAGEARTRVERDVTAFLVAQIAAMPTLLQLPYRGALAAFDLLPLVRYSRLFRRLDGTAGAAWLAAWTARGGLPARNFVKLLRSCALLAYFDHPLVVAALASGRRSEAAA